MLFYRPYFDLPTKYSSYWLGLLAEEASKLGFQVFDLYASQAIPENFLSIINSYPVDLVFADGHGSPTVLTGQNKSITLEACINDQVLSGKTVLAVSCLTAQQLGPSAVKKKAIGYIGFMPELTWAITPPDYNPATDLAAKPFQDMIVTLGSAILRGTTLKEAYNSAVATVNQWIQRLWSSPDPDAASIISYLTGDRDGLIVYGEGGFSLIPKLAVPTWAWLVGGLGVLSLIFIGKKYLK